MPSVLSTKTLSAEQQKTFCETGIDLIHYNAILIETIDFKMPDEVENALFTSKNGVKAVINDSADAKKIKNCFCVGTKTAALLEKNGLKPLKIAENGADLADFIMKNHSEKSFCFFCGDKRREELPAILKAENIDCTEITTYKTYLNPQHFDQDFDAVLFFSPSGIQSFVKSNDLSQKMAICIGKTTAAEAEKHTNNIAIANCTTVESVIEKAVALIENSA